MRHLPTILAALLVCAAPAQAQTLKSLMFNSTNGQVVANTGTNVLTFTNDVNFDLGGLQFDSTQIRGNGLYIDFDDGAVGGGSIVIDTNSSIVFQGASAAATRTNLGLGATNDVTFGRVFASEFSGGFTVGSGGLNFEDNSDGVSRTNLGLGGSNIVTFAGLTNNGDITINNTTATNGILFIRRTNNEPFLGLANLIASNNTTISNETLFRVGVAEATNRSAQFGFRSTNTNGNGVAVFSVFGFNALMMVGADTSTNAVIYSGGGTNNEVMTLIKSGATEFARPIAFSTTAHAAATRTNLALGSGSDPTFRDVSVRDLSIVGGSGGKIVYPATNTAPANTTNVVTWIQVNVGTNSYRVPLYQ